MWQFAASRNPFVIIIPVYEIHNWPHKKYRFKSCSIKKCNIPPDCPFSGERGTANNVWALEHHFKETANPNLAHHHPLVVKPLQSQHRKATETYTSWCRQKTMKGFSSLLRLIIHWHRFEVYGCYKHHRYTRPLPTTISTILLQGIGSAQAGILAQNVL
jgi:hypothetical protein